MKRIVTRISLAALFLSASMVVGAQAQFRTGEGQTHDEVTGLLCVTPACDTVRLDTREARCICRKLNPSERRLSQLQLQCSTTEQGRWVECPAELPWRR